MSSLCAVPLALATTIAAKAAKVLGFLLTGCILHHYPVEGVHTVAASFNSNMPNPMHVGHGCRASLSVSGATKHEG